MSAEEQLEWEARRRPLTSATTFAAGILTIAGGIFSSSAYSGFPKDSPGAPIERVRFINEHAGSIIGATVVQGIAVLLLTFPLVYLFVATRARRPEMPKIAQFTAMASPGVFAVATILQQVFVASSASDWAGGPQYYATARDALQTDPILATAILQFASQVALGFALVLVSLNAMRAGLLTRFMGILGVIAGVLFVIPLVGASVPIVLAFWLMALSYLISGRWPNGVPPAWATGEAVPWPSQQELREAREREAGGGAGPSPSPSAEPATAEGPAHPVSKKRKRKRRR